MASWAERHVELEMNEEVVSLGVGILIGCVDGTMVDEIAPIVVDIETVVSSRRVG